jgi:hypothetical protein
MITTESKYYVLDFGHQMEHWKDMILSELVKHGYHCVYYETEEPYLIALEEITEDQFLEHFKPQYLN